MRGGEQLTVGILALATAVVALRCNREPEGHSVAKSRGDGNFLIKISGNPEKFVPNEKYTISLQGERQAQAPHKFTGFMLTVEPVDMDGMSTTVYHRNAGSFSVSVFGDALTKYSERCPNAVEQASSTLKSEVQVIWTAPPAGNECVQFRATVVGQRNEWYMDDGRLTRQICEQVQDNADEQTEVVNLCCACDEAKYEVTFEGLWSRHTHPKDFPSNGWLTRFSDVIGASHTHDYRFWEYGRVATRGLQKVAEEGATRMLESELKAKSEQIRTIIKARGISYPNVTGKTFAVFRVDRKHHLMSLVSKIVPSPDWIVGVSGFELCLRNCSWVEHKSLNLYPWDVGTDSGVTYESENIPSIPKETIRRITASYPNDERSPFYDPTGERMKPLARLTLSRQRLYEKSCLDDTSATDDTSGELNPDCEMSIWQDGPCSVTCGRGFRRRQRFYLDTIKAQLSMCNRSLTMRVPCIAKQRSCGPGDTDGDGDMTYAPLCALSDWTPWSPCSKSCGKGVQARSRHFVHRQHRKQCNINPTLQQTIECTGEGGEGCDEDDYEGVAEEEENEEESNCLLTTWSMWSPCSVTCGKGRKLRTRLPVATDKERMLMLGPPYENVDLKDCAHTMEEVECESDIPSCEIPPELAKGVCRLPREVGPCRTSIRRWFFDSETAQCQPFSYTGCRGNRNNFMTQEECESICGGLEGDDKDTPTFGGLKPGSQIRDHNESAVYGVNTSTLAPYTVEDMYITSVTGKVVNCKASRWSDWSPCNVTCGRGFKTRSRQILVHPLNGGHACPKKLLKKKRCRGLCTDSEPDQPEDIYMKSKLDQPLHHEHPRSSCMLSAWSPWSACSMTCGESAQQRTRRILRRPREGGAPCGERVETRSCELLPCKEPY